MTHATLGLDECDEAQEPAPQQHRPTLSVTVLNYNYGHYLAASVESILSQTFEDFELFVIDDCSTDGSIDVVRPYLADPRVRLIAHPRNRGYVKSLIEGTETLPGGEFVTVISADDLVRRKDSFERQIELLQASPGAAFCFSAYDRFESETGQIYEEHHSYAGSQLVPGRAFMRDYLTRQQVQVLHSGTVIRKGAYIRSGGYRRDLRMTVDLALWPVLALFGDVAYCDEVLYGYRTHSGQMSSSVAKSHANVREVLRSVDGACDAAVRRGVPIGSLREDATRYALFAIALDDAFGGRLTLALYRCLSGIVLRPRLALTSRGLWIILACAILGEAGYNRILGLLRASSRIWRSTHA